MYWIVCVLFQYENKEQLYEHMVECDIIVYDITENPDTIDEAVWAVSGWYFLPTTPPLLHVYG